MFKVKDLHKVKIEVDTLDEMMEVYCTLNKEL